LLRKEGITSSLLHNWRVAQSNGLLRDTKAIKRGPQKQLRSSQKELLSNLQKENASLKRRLEKAMAMVELQKKIAEILNLPEEVIIGVKSCS
jgi:transposase